MGTRKLLAGLALFALLAPPPQVLARPIGETEVPDAPEPALPRTRPGTSDEPPTSTDPSPTPTTTPSSGPTHGEFGGLPNSPAAEMNPRPRCRAEVLQPRRSANGYATPADYDGDGRFDVSAKHDNGEWSIDYAANGFGAWDLTVAWDPELSFIPLPGDYDGDCRADMAGKDTAGNWRIDYAVNGFGAWDRTLPGFGGAEFTPFPADYDGDGAVDLSTKDSSGHWYVDYAINGLGNWDESFPGFGGTEYAPVPADYDGDGRADFSTKGTDGYWRIDYASDGRGEADWDATYPGFGGPEFMPVPADYDGDGKADFSTRDDWDHWYVDFSSNGRGEENWDAIYHGLSSREYVPVPADYDGDHRADLASHTDDGDWLLDLASDGLGTWNQTWSSLVTVSVAGGVTSEDIRKFDSRWMQPGQQGEAVGSARWWTYDRFGAGVWATGERMAAMVRMFEVTRQTRYLDHLRDLIKGVLEFRDDKHPGPLQGDDRDPADLPQAQPLDELRGARGLPAWGGSSIDSAGRHCVSETVSNVYTYPIAAFARLVAEDPTLHAEYGEDAVTFANAALDTVHVFLPQIRDRRVGQFNESYLVGHPNLATAWTAADCAQAHQDELDAYEDQDETPSEAEEKRMNTQEKICKDMIRWAGLPIAHNENQAFMMVLIELTRVLESTFYREATPSAASLAAFDRTFFPLLVSRSQRYFADHLQSVPGGPDGARYRWHHVDDVPSARWDDASHGALSMRYLRLLNRDLARLNASASLAGEPIAFAALDHRRFANTFLYMLRGGNNLADNVDGAAASPVDSRNDNCDGWVDLSAVDPRIYDACHEMTLRIQKGAQPKLTVGAHAALLENGRMRNALLAWTGIFDGFALLMTSDRDADGIGDASDNCPRYATQDRTDTDGDGRGDACQCGDQDGNGRISVSDATAVNRALFNPSLATPLCDANGDGRCSVTDIVAINNDIFSPGSTSICARHPVLAP